MLVLVQRTWAQTWSGVIAVVACVPAVHPILLMVVVQCQQLQRLPTKAPLVGRLAAPLPSCLICTFSRLAC